MYDFIIIDSEIVDLSVGMTLAQRHPKIRIAILEKENELAYHQSGYNSGVIHSEIYYKLENFKASKFTANFL